MSSVDITDNTGEFLGALNEAMERALETCGLVAEAYAKIELSTPKEHADGKVRPNVDTGRLRNSITHQVDTEEGAVYVGTNVEYAAYVELGTSKSRAYPYLRPAAENHTDEYSQIIRSELQGQD